MEMNWISVRDALPVIPKDRFAVSVIVVLYDPIEASGRWARAHPNPLCGVSVFHGSYSYVRYPDPLPEYLVKLGHKPREIISRWFEGTNKEMDFTSYVEGPKGSEVSPFFDPVTHWMYFPEPPKDYDYERYFGYTESDNDGVGEQRDEAVAD